MNNHEKYERARKGGPKYPAQIVGAHIPPQPPLNSKRPKPTPIDEKNCRQVSPHHLVVRRLNASFKPEEEGGQVRSHNQGKMSGDDKKRTEA
jgi:hypothetical protein